MIWRPWLSEQHARCEWSPPSRVLCAVRVCAGAPYINPGGTITLISGGNSVKPGAQSAVTRALVAASRC